MHKKSKNCIYIFKLYIEDVQKCWKTYFTRLDFTILHVWNIHKKRIKL